MTPNIPTTDYGSVSAIVLPVDDLVPSDVEAIRYQIEDPNCWRGFAQDEPGDWRWTGYKTYRPLSPGDRIPGTPLAATEEVRCVQLGCLSDDDAWRCGDLNNTATLIRIMDDYKIRADAWVWFIGVRKDGE